MLDKFARSKIFCLILFFFCLTSCKKEPIFNSEIICPDGKRILVRFARAKDVIEGIQKAHINKKREGTGETYTPIRLPDKRSFRVEKIPPEKMIECQVVESEFGAVDPNYVRHF
jgi:hypothetical protein